jgi:hypothetical protein
MPAISLVQLLRREISSQPAVGQSLSASQESDEFVGQPCQRPRYGAAPALGPGFGVRRLSSVEDVRRRWKAATVCIAGESFDGQACTVAKEAPQRYLPIAPGFAPGRRFPRADRQARIFVERELAFLGQP